MQLSTKHMQWLKICHLFCASCWVGGAFSLVLLHFIRFIGLGTGSELHGIDRAAHVIDMGIIVIIGAFGCALTGLCYSLFTKWGFYKHRWILVKWIITIVCILFGTFFLGEWEATMVQLSGQLAEAALNNFDYNTARWCNFVFGFMQGLVLTFVIWVSVTKPWKRTLPNKP